MCREQSLTGVVVGLTTEAERVQDSLIWTQILLSWALCTRRELRALECC
jgi:hypothetical protein